MKVLDSLAPQLIKQTSWEIDKISEARIKQVINDDGQEIQKIAPQIIVGALEDLGKKRFSQLKRKLSKIGIK